MNGQLKRGVTDVCVLSVLYSEDSYGYEIIKKLSGMIELSESTLYPLLKRLEGAEYLTVYTVEHNSRLRKYYKITDAGKKRVGDFLEEWREMTEIYEFVKGVVSK